MDRIAKELVMVAKELMASEKTVYSSEDSARQFVKIAKRLVEAELSDEAREEIRDDILRALGGVPRNQKRNPEFKKLNKDIQRALNSM